MKIFIDANILVAVLNNEYPLFTYSARILSLSDNKKFTLYTSPVCISIAWYFAKKKSGEQLARKKIITLCNHIQIAASDASSVINSIANIKIHDIEDGIQYYSALNAKCKVIVTENISDFYFSELEVLDSKSFLEKYVFSLK